MILPQKQQFGFTVESVELRQMIKTQFELLWNAPKPIKPSTEGKTFLQKHGLEQK